jgi:hypothetical protein
MQEALVCTRQVFRVEDGLLEIGRGRNEDGAWDRPAHGHRHGCGAGVSWLSLGLSPAFTPLSIRCQSALFFFFSLRLLGTSGIARRPSLLF